MPDHDAVPQAYGCKVPQESHWLAIETGQLPVGSRYGVLSASAWQRGPLRVISTVDVAEYPDGKGTGPQWHLSVAIAGMERRPSAVEMKLVRRAFEMLDAEEDNHEPGNARHLFLPIDKAHRVDCECKASEVQVVDPDGHRWTTPKDGPCTGCEMTGITGRPCTLHSGLARAVTR